MRQSWQCFVLCFMGNELVVAASLASRSIGSDSVYATEERLKQFMIPIEVMNASWLNVQITFLSESSSFSVKDVGPFAPRQVITHLLWTLWELISWPTVSWGNLSLGFTKFVVLHVNCLALQEGVSVILHLGHCACAQPKTKPKKEVQNNGKIV